MKIRKALAAVLAATIATVSLAGCFGGPQVNDKMTQLYVYAYDGGYGREYLNTLYSRFAEAYKDKSYEDGKSGVEIIPTFELNSSTGTDLLDAIDNKRDQLFVTGYLTPNDLMSSGKVMDITEIVSEPVTEGEGSILDKMDDELVDFYKTNTGDKVYGLPLFDAFYGFYYDAGLLDEKKMWIGAGSDDENITFVGANGNKSLGADGLPDTYDDGLPDTYTQFYLWCEKMKTDKGIIPFTWSGLYQGHFDRALTNLWATYEGAEQMSLNYNFSGTANNIVTGVTSSGVTVESVDINHDNGYVLQKQAGKYYATEFAKKVADNDWIYNLAFSNSEDHRAAQTTYISSTVTGSKPIALFAEGNWWVSEATETFTSYEPYGSGKKDRKFAFLPVPKANRDLVGTDTVIVNQTTTNIMFVKKDISEPVKEVIRDFIKFMHTNDNLSMQNRVTGMTKPYDYTVTDADLAEMDYFTKSQIEMKNAQKVKFLYAASDDRLFLANYATFSRSAWECTSRYRDDSDVTSDACIKVFRDNPSLTAKRYFDGYYLNYNVKTGNNSKWDVLLNKIK